MPRVYETLHERWEYIAAYNPAGNFDGNGYGTIHRYFLDGLAEVYHHSTNLIFGGSDLLSPIFFNLGNCKPTC